MVFLSLLDFNPILFVLNLTLLPCGARVRTLCLKNTNDDSGIYGLLMNVESGMNQVMNAVKAQVMTTSRVYRF